MERSEYSACIHKERSPDAITVDKGFLETIKQEARVLPLFEERIHKYKYTKSYSLINNEMLKCRWSEFVNMRKPRIPFMFPSTKELHFVNGRVVLDPKETVNNRVNHRFHLRSGPDIDKFDIGCQGRISDGGVLYNTSLFQMIKDEFAHLPHLQKLEGRNTPVPFYFIGDDAFPIKEYETTPLSSKAVIEPCRAVIHIIFLEEALRLPPSENEAVLPLFERKINNYKREKYCSLQTNELLRCRWQSYTQSRKILERIPIKFPSLRHLHFHNYDVKYMPSQTPIKWKTYKMQLKNGPGIDQYGQTPIPEDMQVLPRTKQVLESSKAKKRKH